MGFDSKGLKVSEDRSDVTFMMTGVRVTSPAGGATLVSGETNTITWETIGGVNPGGILIHYSQNGGTKWIQIADISKNSGSFSWLVPAAKTAKNKCKVKVTLRDANKNVLTTDISEGYFTIQPSQ